MDTSNKETVGYGIGTNSILTVPLTEIIAFLVLFTL